MEMITVTAKTVEDAITQASLQLGVSSDRIQYEVVEKGSAGVLGGLFGSKPAVIRAKKIETVDDKAVDFLNSVFDAMGLAVDVEVKMNEEEKEMDVNLIGEEMGLLIGKRGQTLDSLQYLVSLVVNKESEDYLRVKLDTENYRERRKETLENLAHNLAHKVKRIHRPVYLEPMNPYERRVIHSALQKDKYVETHSEGDEPYRKVVITLKPGVDTGYERRGKYSYGNSRYGKRNNGGYHKKYNNSYQKKYDEYEKDSSEDVQDNE